MPHEHEIPAPVTTTIFFDFATAREISERVRLTYESVAAASSSSVTVIVTKKYAAGRPVFNQPTPELCGSLFVTIASRLSRDSHLLSKFLAKFSKKL